MNTPLTQKEINAFIHNIQMASVILETDRIYLRKDLDRLRGLYEIKEEDLIKIDAVSEKVCRIYNVLSIWKLLLEKGIPEDRLVNEDFCLYVRTLNTTFVKKEGE